MGVVYQSLRGAQHDNGSTVSGAVCMGSPSVTYATGSVSSSTDPFSGKTNKYAESKLVRITASAFGHVKFSAAGTAADTSSSPLPAGIPVLFAIGAGQEYVRVIPTTGSASFWVEEVY